MALPATSVRPCCPVAMEAESPLSRLFMGNNYSGGAGEPDAFLLQKALHSSVFSWRSMPIALLLATIAVFACSVVHNLHLSSLSHIPGPFWAKVSPFWLMRAVWRRHLNQDVQALHNKYGPVVRLSPSELSFSTTRAQEDIHCRSKLFCGTETYRSSAQDAHQHQPDHFTKSETLESLMGEIVWPAPNLLTVTEPEEHKRLKRALQPAFTQKALTAQEAIQQRHVDDMVERLRGEVAAAGKTGAAVNLTPFLSRAVWQIISDLSFGEPLVQDQFDKFERLKTLFCMISPVLEGLQCILAIPIIGLILRTVVVLFCKLVWLPTDVLPSSRLRDRVHRQDHQQDFISAILGCAEKGISMTDLEMKSNASLIVMVGYDTTATTLSATMHLLMRHPHYLSRLAAELRTAFPNGGLSDTMTNAALSTLPMLNGVIQETLRLLPPANGKGTNRTSPGAVVAGVRVPAGVLVSADMYTIQRSGEYWRRPEEFLPERWFDNDDVSGEFTDDCRAAHRPFLLGSRVCIGRAVAMQTLRLAVAKLVCAFDLEDGEPGYVWERDVESSYLWIGYRANARMREVVV